MLSRCCEAADFGSESILMIGDNFFPSLPSCSRHFLTTYNILDIFFGFANTVTACVLWNSEAAHAEDGEPEPSPNEPEPESESVY
jgi:hypothetical protein